MRYDPDKHHRHSIRLKGYDYSQPGAYFMTIVTQGRACLFGDIVDGEMRLNEYGKIVESTWHDLVNHVAGIVLDAFVVMPNHVHGIVIITNAPDAVGAGSVGAGSVGAGSVGAGSVGAGSVGAGSVGAGSVGAGSVGAGSVGAGSVGAGSVGAGSEPAPTGKPKRHGLPEIIRQFKTFSARRINHCRKTGGVAVWQRNYYEHIIRNEHSLSRIRQYILNNPARWAFDRENPAATMPEPEDAWLH